MSPIGGGRVQLFSQEEQDRNEHTAEWGAKQDEDPLDVDLPQEQNVYEAPEGLDSEDYSDDPDAL